MAITFPAWWTPEHRARVRWIEDTCMQLVDNIGFGGLEAVWWMPTDEERHEVLFDRAEGYVRIYRLHGEVDLNDNLDVHRVQFAVITANRNTSVQVLSLIQQVLYAYEYTSYVTMQDGAKRALKFLGETLGPQLDPQLIRDERLVSMTVALSTPWPKGLPDIRSILGL